MIQLFNKQARTAAKIARISLVVCDLDGTMFNDNGVVLDEAATSLKALSDAGVDFILASARTAPFTEQIAGTLGSRMPVVALNGGIIAPMDEGEAFAYNIIPQGVLDPVLFADENTPRVEITAFTPKGLYATSEDAVVPKYLRSDLNPFGLVDDIREVEHECALYILYGPFAAVQHASVQIAQHAGGLVRRIQYPGTTRPDYSYLEIQNAKTNKGSAVAYICKQTGIARNQVAAIGDYINDLELLRWAGFSGAVSNAIDEVKLIADVVTEGDNNSGGVAEFFNLILEAKANR